jgi:hypothetical protein
MSLTFAYIPLDKNGEDGDQLEIRTPYGRAILGDIGEVTPTDEGSEAVEGLIKLQNALKKNKSILGGVHIFNGGLQWKFHAETNTFSVSTSLFLCETELCYTFLDEKEKGKTIDQIGQVLQVMIPLVKKNAERIRQKNLRDMETEKNDTKTQRIIHLRVPHRKHPRGILDVASDTVDTVDTDTMSDTMSDMSTTHEKWLEEQHKDKFSKVRVKL